MPESLAPSFALDRQPTPIGDMMPVVDESGALRALDWHDYEPRMRLLLRRQYPVEPELVPGRAPPAIRD
ncbi:hypothetical protein ACSTLO_00015, partial [Vibrio parahaemolyticus]